jgi:hypothetical protein
MRFVLGTALAVALAGSMVARPSLAHPQHQPRHHGRRVVVPFQLSGTPIAECTWAQAPAVAAIVRVALLDPIDAIFDPHVAPSVRYTTLADSDNDDNGFNNSQPDNWSGHLTGSERVPYDVDLTNIGLDTKKDTWIELKFLFKTRGDENARIDEFTVDNPSSAAIMCYQDLAHNNHNGRTVSILFVKHPKGSQTVTYYSNILLRAMSGAFSTPIVIDPKIMNSG